MSNNVPNNATVQNPLGVGVTAARSQPLRERSLKMPNSPPNAISPQLVWYSLVRWWKIAVPIGLACAVAAAGAVWVTFQQEYRASVWIQIFETPQYLVFGEKNGPATSGLFVATQMQLLSSPMVMYGTDDIGPEGVVDELLNGKLEGWSGSNVPDLPSEEDRDRAYLGDWISKGVSVTRVGKTSELYTVSFTSTSPRFAKAIADAVSRNYLALLANQLKTRNSEIIELLKKANTNRITDLTVDRKVLDVLAKGLPGRPGILGKPEVESPAQGTLAALRASLTTAEVDLELLRAEVQTLQDASSAQVPDLATASAAPADVLSHPSVLQKAEELSQLKATLKRIEEVSVAGKDDPLCPQIQNQIESLEQTIEEEVQIRCVQDRDRNLAGARAELEKKQAAVKSLKKYYDDLLVQAQQGNSASLELELKLLEVGRKQEVIGRIDERIQALSTEQSAPEQVTLWRWADEPSRSDQLYPTRQLALAIPAGLALPFVLFLLWEFLARRVFSSDRLEQDLDLPVLGEIARLPKRRVKAVAKSGDRFDRSLQLFRESIDALSTNLALLLDLRGVRVLAVASAVNSEGKTSVAAELARRLAENMHAKVLLIDADMRSPDIHRLFQIPCEPGLAAVLAEQATLEQAIVTWSDRLHLLPAGHLSGGPAALLGNGNVKSLLERVLADYRFVVIDTPPVLPASESLILSSAADATLLCVMCEVSRGDQVRRAYKRLLLSGSRNVGLVVNGVPTQQYQRRYGKYPYAAS